MKLINRSIVIFFVTAVLFLDPYPISAEWIRIDINKKDRTMSADIKQAPLKSVVENIQRKKDIWIKGDHYLEDKTISVEFEDLPIKKGIDRIFSTLNHSLLFDQDGKLLGIFIVGIQEKKRSRPSAVSSRRGRRPTYRRR